MFTILFGLPLAAVTAIGTALYDLPIPIAGPLLLGVMVAGRFADEVRRQSPLRARR